MHCCLVKDAETPCILPTDAAAEKITRGGLKSGVNHALNAKTLVILDSLNYIKGFRYELYCSARSEGTQHCVVSDFVSIIFIILIIIIIYDHGLPPHSSPYSERARRGE